MSLELTEFDGTPAANDQVAWENTDTDNYTETTTNSSGVASTTLTDGETYEVTYEQFGSSVEYPKDGSPDVFAIGTRTYNNDTTDSTTLPVGHNLSVEVVNDSGNPIANATVFVDHERDGALAFVRAETNSSGILVHPNSDGPGFEVNGTVGVHVDPPNEQYQDEYTEVTVNNDRSITITLEPVVNASGTVRYPNGTRAENVTLRWVTADGNDTDFEETVTGPNGTYEARLEEDRNYEVRIWQANLWEVENFSEPTNVAYPRDGVADFASLGWLNTSTSDVTQNHSFPVGHVLNVTVQNESGTGIENASVELINKRNGAWAFVYGYLHADGLPTDQWGRMYHPPNSEVGLEVNGTTEIRAHPPENSSYGENSTEITVASDRNVTLTLDEATQSVTVFGEVEYPNGTAASNVTLRWITEDGGPTDFEQAVTNQNGTYMATLEPNRNYEVKLWQADLRGVNASQPTNVAYPRDGVADFTSLGWLNTSTNDTFQAYSFPVGHVLNVTVVNESGAGIENASVGLTNERNGARASVYSYLHADGLPTDGWGRMYHPPNPEVGLEVNGTTEIDVRPPENTSYGGNWTEVTVTNDRHVTLTLDKTHEVEGRWVGPNGNGIGGADVWVINFSTDAFEQTTTDSNGYFNTTVPEDGTYRIYVNSNQTDDGIADAWLVENVSVNGVTNVGELMMPPGHSTTINVTDYDGEQVDSYIDVIGGNKGWSFNYQYGRQLDSPSHYDTRTADLTLGSHVVTVRDAWTHDVLAERPITVLGNGTVEFTVDRFNGTRTSGTAGTTVARDLQSPTADQTIQDVLNESINVRLFVLNATTSTYMHVNETLPAGYELDGTAANVSADGPGQIENVNYDNGTLSFDVNGTVTEVRYRAVPNGSAASEVQFSGRFHDVPTMGETSLPAETNVTIFGPVDGSTVNTPNPFVRFVTRHPDATNATTVEYRVDGGPWKEIGDVPAIGGAQLAGLDDGKHTVTIRLVNESGTVVTDNTTFNVST